MSSTFEQDALFSQPLQHESLPTNSLGTLSDDEIRTLYTFALDSDNTELLEAIIEQFPLDRLDSILGEQ